MGKEMLELEAGFAVGFLHRLRFSRDVFAPDNRIAAELVQSRDGEAARVLVFIDQGVADAWPNLARQVELYAEANPARIRLACPIHMVPGGERCKNDRAALERILEAIHDAKLDRQSYVTAIGGGAVLDAVGFAAAITHRGLRLIRLPTTTLSQADSGVGIKNGVNAFGKKNYLGVFSPPWAVINDELLLATLSDRDWRSGFAEAVKVALVKDANLFDRIAKEACRLRCRDSASATAIIRHSAELHLQHIVASGDPFELHSARPLDFGHWAAHKLEQMTEFSLRHGEAVAIGIALDVTYSEMAGLLDPFQSSTILGCLETLGVPLYHEAMADHDTLLEGLEEFREHLGGQLTIMLLESIGRPHEVHEIERGRMCAAIERLVACRPQMVRGL